VKISVLILGISGSPRKCGNTDTAVRVVLEEIEMLTSHKTKFIRICDLNIRFCTGCRFCMKSMECAIKEDDFHALWDEIVKADLIIMGAPVYWNSPPGPMKDFIDRTHTWYACPQKFPAGKRMGLISIAADSGFESHEDIMTCWAYYYGIKVVDKIRLLARETGDVKKNDDKINKLVSKMIKVLERMV
jgi:multimeric flavodoxin WrbA